MPGKNKDESSKQNRKNAYGEGSVFQRSDGRWVAKVPLGDGKHKTGYFEKQRDAEKAKRQWLNDLEQGRLVTAKDQLLSEYLEYWLKMKKTLVRETTYAHYQYFVETFIVPYLGHIKVQKLTSDMLQSYYTKLFEERQFSANTIRFIHSIIRGALKDAVKWKRLPFNPASDATPPHDDRGEMSVLTLEQAQRLLNVVDSMKFKCILTLAIATGMRRGELLGLRWSDIDWEKS